MTPAVIHRAITCWDLREVIGKPPCCVSCHDEGDEFGTWMSGDGENWNICCVVGIWLEDNGVDTLEVADQDNPIVKVAMKSLRECPPG
jgi:hypothetical protein